MWTATDCKICPRKGSNSTTTLSPARKRTRPVPTSKVVRLHPSPLFLPHVLGRCWTPNLAGKVRFLGGVLQYADLAQLVEHRTEDPGVPGSIPGVGTCGETEHW